MDEDIQKFFNKAKRASLSSLEREEMRGDLEQFMSERPVRNARALRLIRQGRSKFSIPAFMELFSLKPLMHNLQPMTIALIIALLIGGGASFAAEGALPGDILYPVKVSINEEIRGAVAFSDTAQAGWDARRAERRLEEAEELAAEGRLDAEMRAQIATRFESHAEAFQERAERIEENQDTQDSFEIHSNFEASLKAHESVLARLATEKASIRLEIEALLLGVRARLGETAKARADVEASVSAEVNGEFRAAAEGKLRAAENKTTEVRNFITRVKASASAQAYTRAQARLNAAAEVIARGKTEVEDEAYGKAFASFQEAIRISQEAKLVLASEDRINLEVTLPGINVKVESDDDLEGDVRTGGDMDIEAGNEGGTSSDTGASVDVDLETEVEAGNDGVEVGGDGKVRIDVGL